MTFGHGRPAVEPPRLFRLVRAKGLRLFLALPYALVLASLFAAASAQEAKSVDCELRIVWGGPTSRPFEGQISIDSGNLRPIRNLSLQPDSIGAIRSLNPATVELLPHSPSQFGGVDLHVRGELSSQLLLSLQDPFTREPVEHAVALRELLQGNWIESIDSRGTRLAIERQMHDRLRVELGNASEILEVNDPLTLRVRGYRTGLSEGGYSLTARLLKDGQAMGNPWNTNLVVDQDGSFTKLDWETMVPQAEGAYSIELSLRRARFLNNLVSTSAAITRRVDFVALDLSRRTDQIMAWHPLLRIDMLEASKPGSLAWLAPLTEFSSYVGLPQQYRIFPSTPTPSISHGALESRPLPSSKSLEDRDCLAIAPDGWIALPLSDLKPGIPHRLRVRVPTDLPMKLAISVRTPDVDGDLPSVNADSGFVIDARQCTSEGAPATHDLTFWPNEGTSYLLFANTDETHIASLISVEVEVAEMGQPQQSIANEASRLLGLYLDKPLIATSFSTLGERDPLTGRQLNGWKTWFEATERLEQYMIWTDADTLVLKVLAEGGGIFPSQRLEPSRRFDSGTFFSDSRSPEIKDAIELLLRRFDREGNHLILALDFDAPLPGLSRWAEQEDAVLQRDLEGASWPRNPLGGQRRTERYNPIDSRVQSEFLAAIREIVDRYGAHPSFAGIALQLDQNSQLVFAGDRWGFDDESLARFAHATQVRLPQRERLEQIFSGPTRLALMNWRAKEMTKLYAQMSAVIKRKQPTAKLYLNAVRLWERLPNADDFVDPDAIIRNPSEFLMAYGIDPEGIAGADGVMLMHGSLNRFWESNNSKDWVLGLSSMRALQSVSADSDAAVVVQHPSGFRLSSLNKLGGVAKNPNSGWVFPHASGYGDFARKELVEQLYYSDPLMLVSGGWLPVPGQEESVKSLYRTLKDFPPVALKPMSPFDPQSSLRIRSGVYQGKTFIQIVNNAPWTESVKLRVQSSSANPRVRALGDRDSNLLVKNADIWELQIRPFDVIGLEVADSSLEVTGMEHTSSNQTIQRIASELQEIEAVITEAGDPTQRKQLVELGGTFENWSTDEKPIGWNVSSLPNVQIYRSNEFPHSGRSSLVIENQNTSNVSAWIQSRSFSPPTTGRLAVQAWLRAPSAGNPMKVRLSIVGRLANGERFERSHLYGGADTDGTIANDWGRRPASLFVADVPPEQLTELNVAIDLIGPGKVWIDDIKIFELRLHPDERIYLRGQVLVAKQKLAESNPFPAEQLLDSNWGHYLSEFCSQEEGVQRVAGDSDRPWLTREESLPPSADQQKPIFQQWRDSIRGRWRR